MLKKDSKPLQVINSADAMSALTGTAWYPHPNKDAERLLPYPTIEHKNKFSVSQDAKVFAIGSCFAREIEKAMFAVGLDVVSYDTIHKDDRGKHKYITNKYTPTSILHDLKLATSNFNADDINKSVTQVNSKATRFSNYQFGGGDALKTGAKEDIFTAYESVLKNMNLITECNFVVITLGLVEAWYDKENDIYLNIPPHKTTLANNPTRYELHVLSYEQIVDCLEEIYKTLRATAKVPQDILVTVSPVPLHATYRGQDVLQANCYSKSVLRAAVESFILKNNDVGYFPSYEMVTLSDHSQAWGGADFRHVSSQMVSRIMDASINNYLDGHIPSKAKLQKLILEKSYMEVVELYQNIDIIEHKLRSYIYYYTGVAYFNLKKFDESKDLIDTTIRLQPSHFAAITLRARIALHENDLSLAGKLLNSIADEHRPAKNILEKIAVV